MGFIGGSDLYDIMNGNWNKLWHIKTGREKPEDLSHIFQVQLGSLTEEFNLNWFMKTHVYLQENYIVHTQKEFKKTISGVPYKGTVDAQLVTKDNKFTLKDTTIVECKHTTNNKTMKDMLSMYLPQIHLYMRLSDTDNAQLSVIFGNQYDSVEVTFNEEYWKNVHTQVHQFWSHVENDVEPDTNYAQKIDWKSVQIDGLVARDANKENYFVRTAHNYIETYQRAKENEQYKKELISLMNDNEREVYCDALTIKRDKRGAKRITIKEGVA